MTIRNRPDYQVYLINLTNAGTQDIPAIGSRVVMAGAYLGATLASINGGYQVLTGGTPTSALVNVQIGKTPGDPIPFTVGSQAVVENKFDFVRLQWAAQASVYAVIVVSDDADGNGINVTAPPTVTLGNMSIVEGGNTALVNSDGSLLVGGSQGKFGTSGSADANAMYVRQLGGSVGGSSLAVTNPALNSIPQSSATGSPVVQPGQVGGSTYSNLALASGSTTIVAPASNTHGIVIRSAMLTTTSTATGEAITAGTSAPSSLTSNQNVLLAGNVSGLAVSTPKEVYLPAGQGLYVYALSAAGIANINYDIL